MKKTAGIALILLSLCICFSSVLNIPHGLNISLSASGRSKAFSRPKLPDGTINVNEGDAEELIQLPGIGETLAQAILNERSQNGLFYYPEDLLAVRGIGPSKLAGFRKWLDLNGGE